jgi:hypothetical protein
MSIGFHGLQPTAVRECYASLFMAKLVTEVVVPHIFYKPPYGVVVPHTFYKPPYGVIDTSYYKTPRHSDYLLAGEYSEANR